MKPFLFFKEVRAELDKVAWPNREQTIRLTLIVVGVTVVTGLFLGGFDLLFTKLMEILIKMKG